MVFLSIILSMKHKLSDFIDTLLTFICVSVLAIVCANYFTRKLSVILIAGFTVGLCVTALIGFLRAKKQLPKEKRTRVNNAMKQFMFHTDSENTEFFLNAFTQKYTAEKKDGYLKVGASAVFLALSADKLTFGALATAYAKVRRDQKNGDKLKRLLLFTCVGADKQATETAPLLPDIKCEIFGGEKVFALLKSLNALPKEEIVFKSGAKAGFKALLSEALTKNKAKHYLFAALLLLTSALFLPYGVYYIIVASLLIVLALMCRIDILHRSKARKK